MVEVNSEAYRVLLPGVQNCYKVRKRFCVDGGKPKATMVGYKDLKLEDTLTTVSVRDKKKERARKQGWKVKIEEKVRGEKRHKRWNESRVFVCAN